MISIPEDFPIGVSKSSYEKIAGFCKERPYHRIVDHPLGASEISAGGLRLTIDHFYPKTLEDGTVLLGCMIGANDSRVWLVDGPKEKH